MARLTQAMLERAVGGAQILKELLDKDGDGVADSATITEILDEADAEANSYIGLAVDLSDSTLTTAPMLLRKEQDCAVYLCYLRGTSGQGIPEQVERARLDAIAWYEAVRDRRAGLGLTTRPTASQLVDQVTKTQGTDDWFASAGPRRWFDGFS